MELVTTRAGVPIIIDDDGMAYPLIREYTQDIALMDDEDGFLIDRIMAKIKEAVFVITGIDPTLPHEEWFIEWTAMLTILQFNEPIHVLRDATRLSAQLKYEEGEA